MLSWDIVKYAEIIYGTGPEPYIDYCDRPKINRPTDGDKL
jgi:hypothetical protein